MKRQANPSLSPVSKQILAQYQQTLCEQEDLSPVSLRNYLSDVRHFMAWCEAREVERVSACRRCGGFDPQDVTTPTITRYRTYLQTIQRQKPASINRSLISLKHYFSWAIHHCLIAYDPSAAVKLVGQEASALRHLDDQEEQALIAAVTKTGTQRDRVLIVLLLHTGLRAREICQLRRDQVKLGKRSGVLEIIGKRNKYREVPLNATASRALEEYLPTLPSAYTFLFPSAKTGSKSEELTDFRLKSDQAVRRVINDTDVSGKTASHLVFFL